MILIGAQSLIIGDAELHLPSAAEQIMAMPALRSRPWTLEQVEELIEQRDGYFPRYELADGELLVTPAPSQRHQLIAFELAVLLRSYVLDTQLGDVRLGPGAVHLDNRSYFEPDVYVVPALNGRRQSSKIPVSRLLLVVEVPSPSSSRHDRITKRKYFQRHGVPDYWVVDGAACTFELWKPGDERAVLVDDRLTWHPAGAAVPLDLDVGGFFRAVSDDE